MRFDRLDLIKYGKFTDRSISFPVAEHDFHLIVGPNEAGKSTLRSAILDLLFGIETRSPFNFIHPLNELRLGASVSNQSGCMDFQRAKAQKQTLRSITDAVLADSALTPFLGTADRKFFDQMFGLDHTRLVQGGNSILNAENDVGQILFQSAAGISSLGKIRDALKVEADKLWAPRKAADRVYYIAADQLDKATTALKDATVRTKVWSEAHQKAETLQASLATERERHRQFKGKSERLQRVRRLAPHLMALREKEQQLAELGEVIELPSDAATTLEKAASELAKAKQLLGLRTEYAEKLKDELGKITLDQIVLEQAGDITRLDQLRLQYRGYEHDIEDGKRDIATLWHSTGELCSQLGWQAESEESLAKRLPTLLLRRELGQLARERGGIARGLQSAKQAEEAKRSEIETLSGQLDSLPLMEVKPSLRAALASASSLGDYEASLRGLQQAVNKAQSSLEIAQQALGKWRKPFAELRAMQPPSQQMLTELANTRQSLLAEHKEKGNRREEQRAEIATLELKISQFKELHHLTTREDVSIARSFRDASWQSIKAGEVDFQQSAQHFETLILQADEVADRLLDNVEDATELQSLTHQLDRERQILSGIEKQLVDWDGQLEQLHAQWHKMTTNLGLPDMALENIADWLVKREKTLNAETACQDAQLGIENMEKIILESKRKLAESLSESGLAISDSDSLQAFRIQAQNFIQNVDAAKARQQTLSDQLRTSQTWVETLRQNANNAQAELNRWTGAWTEALAKAGLPPNSEIGTVEGALEIIGKIENNLGEIQNKRIERIDAMSADLQRLSAQAQELALKVAPGLSHQASFQIILELANRLNQARESQQEAKRLRDSLRVANEQVRNAQEAIGTAEAQVQPLIEQAKVATMDSLNEAVARSDRLRQLQGDMTKAKASLLDGGDGLSRAQIEVETDAEDLTQLAAELAQTDDELDKTVTLQNMLSAELADAQRALSDIGGSDAAAQAEAKRQEAIAQMSDAAERYLKVATAARLLRWSIDRYREDKQGPLLEQTSALFSKLTLGSFQRLRVDYEREPLALEGLRPDGRLVGIAGMSDGTRDQLYLALRLAALELHLEQSLPLPFIADDLFINYDDDRSKAGLEALAKLSEKTQVIFLSHHDHLTPKVKEIFGENVNIVYC